MPDICLCFESKCPKSKSCYRFLAKQDTIHQVYFKNHKFTEDGCDAYLPAENNRGRKVTADDFDDVFFIIEVKE